MASTSEDEQAIEKLEKELNKYVRYILVCEKRGLFLGIDSQYAYFAGINSNNATYAPTFPDAKTALDWGYQFLNLGYDYTYYAFPVNMPNKNEQFAHVVDIIKAGWGEYTGDMLCNIRGGSRTIH